MRKIGANRSGNNTKLISYYSPDYSVFRKPEPEPQLFGENIYFIIDTEMTVNWCQKCIYNTFPLKRAMRGGGVIKSVEWSENKIYELRKIFFLTLSTIVYSKKGGMIVANISKKNV